MESEARSRRRFSKLQDVSRAAALGVVTGQLSGLVVLDTDDKEADEFLRGLGLEPHVKTPSGGYHYYFRHPGDQRYKTFNPQNDGLGAQGYRNQYGLLDCRADGGYAAFAGTVTKGSYEQLRDPSDLYELDRLPAELLEVLRHGYGNKSAQVQHTKPALPMPGLKGAGVERLLAEAAARLGSGRDNACYWLAQQLRDNGHDKEVALAEMERFWATLPPTNTKGQHEEFSLQTALDKVGAAYEQPAREPWGGPMYATTDIGNGERLAHAAADSLRYNDTKGWLAWDGKRWLSEGEKSIEVISKRVAKEMTHILHL